MADQTEPAAGADKPTPTESDFVIVSLDRPGLFGFRVDGKTLRVRVDVGSVRTFEQEFGVPMMNVLLEAVENEMRNENIRLNLRDVHYAIKRMLARPATDADTLAFATITKGGFTRKELRVNGEPVAMRFQHIGGLAMCESTASALDGIVAEWRLRVAETAGIDFPFDRMHAFLATGEERAIVKEAEERQGDNITLTQAEYDALPEYSCSVPTGTTIGKQWKCIRKDGAWRGTYVDIGEAKRVGIRWQHITIAG